MRTIWALESGIMLHSQVEAYLPVSVPAVMVCETSPSGLERRHKVRLPDGRIVFSDCFQGEAKSVVAALAECGRPVAVILPEVRFVVPPKSEPRRDRIRKILETEPTCPRCGCRMVPSVPGRRTASVRTACFSADGMVICAKCRSAEAVDLQRQRAEIQKPGRSFSHFGG